MKKLKLAVIGNGGIARTAHLPALIKMENVEIVALCDVKIEKSKELAEKYNIPAVYENYEDVLAIEGLDAVDICTPNYLHSIIAVQALSKGLHVFCEKPDAVSVAEALKMKDAAEQSGKTLMVMRNNRYWESSKFLKKFIEDGKMGDIYAGRCGWVRRRGIPGKGGWFTTKEQSGGGPLIDLGVHMMDVAIWLMGNPVPVAVSGCTYTKFANADTKADSEHSTFGEVKKDGIFDVEDLAMGFVKFDNGACLQIEFSWASNIDEEDNFVELRGSKAGSSWHNAGGSKLKIFAEQDGDTIDILPRIKNDGSKIHGANLAHFVDVVLNGTAPMFVPQQGVNMIKILSAIYESANTGKEVRL